MVPGCDLNTMMSPTRTPKINSVHFPPLGQTEDHQHQRTSPESPSQQIQHKQKQEVEKKVSLVIFNKFIIIVSIVKLKD